MGEEPDAGGSFGPDDGLQAHLMFVLKLTAFILVHLNVLSAVRFVGQNLGIVSIGVASVGVGGVCCAALSLNNKLACNNRQICHV